jgi:hypothetical protein
VRLHLHAVVSLLTGRLPVVSRFYGRLRQAVNRAPSVGSLR